MWPCQSPSRSITGLAPTSTSCFLKASSLASLFSPWAYCLSLSLLLTSAEWPPMRPTFSTWPLHKHVICHCSNSNRDRLSRYSSGMYVFAELSRSLTHRKKESGEGRHAKWVTKLLFAYSRPSDILHYWLHTRVCFSTLKLLLHSLSFKEYFSPNSIIQTYQDGYIYELTEAATAHTYSVKQTKKSQGSS